MTTTADGTTGAQHTEHEIIVQAPPGTVYELIADAQSWPQTFPPTVHVDILDEAQDQQRMQIWATANGDVKSWTSRRDLDPAGRRISFRQEVSQAPVKSMSGEWRIHPTEDGQSRVVITHDFTALDGSSDQTTWIHQAVERNSTAELQALKASAELRHHRDDLQLTFDDEVLVPGEPSEVYDFIFDAAQWPERIPHVSRVELTQDAAGVQRLVMDTLTSDGKSHTTASIRVCQSPTRIVYKQLEPPALLTVHTGMWRFERADGGTRVTSTHSVVLNPDAVTAVLGPDATVESARTYVRRALGTNSTATIRAAGEFAQRKAAVTGR